MNEKELLALQEYMTMLVAELMMVHLGVDKVIFETSCILTKIITQAGCSSSLPYCTIYILFVHFRDHLVIIHSHFQDHRISYNKVPL